MQVTKLLDAQSCDLRRVWASNPKFPFVHKQTTPAASRTASSAIGVLRERGRRGGGGRQERRQRGVIRIRMTPSVASFLAE